MKKKRCKLMAVIVMTGLLVTACGNQAAKDAAASAAAAEAGGTKNDETDNAGGSGNHKNDTNVISGAAYTGTTIDSSKLFSDRDLSGEYDASECDSITLSDQGCAADSKNVTIDKNTITITGEGDYIISGTLSDGMIIVDVDKSEKVQLVLNGVDITSETSAAIYVKKADKVFVTLADDTENTLANGGAFEAVDDNNIDAVIFSKDDLTLNGTGKLIVKSPAGHGIVSKNELVITNGTYDITAASHGLTGKDNVAIADGYFGITAGKDAIQSQNDDDDTSGFVYIADGHFTLNAGSDGINAVNEIYIAGGTVDVGKSEEGLEARLLNIAGGEIDIISSDDGLNATDKRTSASSGKAADIEQSTNTDDGTDGNGNDFHGGHGTRGNPGGFGGGMGDTQADANIHISGGIVRIDAEGDGVDSNGYLTVSGGELYVAGPSNGGNGALDYGIDAVISGGIVVAAGQSGMAQNFGPDSTQGTILVNTQQQNAAGSDIVLFDSEGRELAAWTMEKSYNSVVISCPEIKDGGLYTVRTGDVSTEITMDGPVYGNGFGFGGGRPEGMRERPDFENGEKPEGMPEVPDFEITGGLGHRE